MQKFNQSNEERFGELIQSNVRYHEKLLQQVAITNGNFTELESVSYLYSVTSAFLLFVLTRDCFFTCDAAADKLFPKIDSVDSNVKHYVEAFDVTATNAMCTMDSVVLDGKNHLRTHVSCDIHRYAKLRITLLKESRSCPRLVAVTVKR